MATILRPATVTRIAPRPPAPSSLTNTAGPNLLLSTLAGQDVFFGGPGQFPTYDYPPPRPRPAGDRSFLPGTNLALTQPVVMPAGQSTFPAPQSRPSAVGRGYSDFSFVLQQPSNPVPFNQYDWPSPARKPPNPGGFLNPLAVNLIGQDQFFFGAGRAPTYEWPPTRYRPQPSGGFVAGVNLNLIGQDKFFRGPGVAPVYDWPPVRYRQARPDRLTIGINLLQSTLTPSSKPFAQADWPLARPRTIPAAFMHFNWTATFGQMLRVRVSSSFVG